MTTLYVLTDDLRIDDNPALNLAARDEKLAVIYCIDDAVFKTDRFGCRGMGQNRWRFLRQSLQDLNQDLAERGQVLHLLEGDTLTLSTDLLRTDQFSRVIRTRGHDHRTNLWWNQLVARFVDIEFIEVDGSTLFDQEQIQFETFPDSFSSFRKGIEDRPFRHSVSAPNQLPGSLDLDSRLITAPTSDASPRGGSLAGKDHLTHYFSTEAACVYKETRNALHGEHYSTGFSTYLANGSLSPIQVVQQLFQYEREFGKNESTQWILFELLWREFFRWYGLRYGDLLFEFAGINGQRPLTSFYRDRFIKWTEGRTPWPLVNAAMNELRETGLISNRARQIVASCLVNELEVDWRCGASYFAEQLIDYDACSNWGNWQYIAGVGADPRGGRHFNIDKQTELFDPDASYRNRWGGAAVNEPLDSVDYYDWPVERIGT